MARKVFFSFHFNNDFWRTQQVRNMNALEGNPLCSANAWEEVKKKGDAAVEQWIANEMRGRSCVIVLVGAETANRKWVRREIVKGWNDKKGVPGDLRKFSFSLFLRAGKPQTHLDRQLPPDPAVFHTAWYLRTAWPAPWDGWRGRPGHT